MTELTQEDKERLATLQLLVSLRHKFRSQASIIQRINTGELPADEAGREHPSLIQALAQFQAILNDDGFAKNLLRLGS